MVEQIEGAELEHQLVLVGIEDIDCFVVLFGEDGFDLGTVQAECFAAGTAVPCFSDVLVSDK